MKRFLPLLLVLTSCWNHSVDQPIVQNVSPRKQRQKIVLLKKKLEQAEGEQKKAEEEVEKIAAEIHTAELALIRRQIDQYERVHHKTPVLFLEERETLYRMIQEGRSVASLEAQLELDRILRMITSQSDIDNQ